MANKLVLILLVFLQCYTIFAIVENRWSQFRAGVTFHGCTRLDGAFDIARGLTFGPDFSENSVARQRELDPTVWIQVCDPNPQDVPLHYRETFRFDGANGGIAAVGYKLLRPIANNQDAVDSCNSDWIISPWGDWQGRTDNIIGHTGIKGSKGENGRQGATGVQGPTGVNGSNGVDGAKGCKGVPGIAGGIGDRGIDGATGLTGETGPRGETGPQGQFGSSGVIGIQGAIGLTGETGIKGIQGQQGVQGIEGVQGNPGLQGLVGVTGPQGEQGVVGDQGVTGFTGPTGLVGFTGPQGVVGVTGPQGLVGETGVIGDTGLQGPQGVTGPQGPQGPQGVTGPQGPQGFTGPTGPTGPQGVTGAVGETGPQGLVGLSGFRGPQGPQGQTGPVGATGARGVDGKQCADMNYVLLYRNPVYTNLYDSANPALSDLSGYLTYGILNVNITIHDGSFFSNLTREMYTPMCSTYCDRVIFAGHGIWNQNYASDPSLLEARTLNLRVQPGAQFNQQISDYVNHFYWILPSRTVNVPEVTSNPGNNKVDAFNKREWDCRPPNLVVGFVTSFIARSTAEITNLKNRCLAYIRIDFQGRVHVYRIGTCSPSFANSGTFDFFSHLDFHGLNYIPAPYVDISQGSKVSQYGQVDYQDVITTIADNTEQFPVGYVPVLSL